MEKLSVKNALKIFDGFLGIVSVENAGTNLNWVEERFTVVNVYKTINAAWIPVLFASPVVAYIVTSGDLAYSLWLCSMLFVPYVTFAIIELSTTIPQPVIFKIPDMNIPPVIDRDHLPYFNGDNDDQSEGAQVARRIVSNLITQIGSAADTISIHSLVEKQFQTIRRKNKMRYARTWALVVKAAYIGFMGTMVGFMAFLAGTDVVMGMFAELEEKILSELDLSGVASAFITTFIGLTGKAWIAKIPQARQNEQEESLIELQDWIQTELLARLNLPSQVTTHLMLEGISELAEPLVEVVVEMKAATRENREVMRDVREVTELMIKAGVDQTNTSRAIARVGLKLQRMGTALDDLNPEDYVVEQRIVGGALEFSVRKKEKPAGQKKEPPVDQRRGK